MEKGAGSSKKLASGARSKRNYQGVREKFKREQGATMGILAYLFPFQPIRIQTCKHIINKLIDILNENVFTHVYIPNRNRNKLPTSMPGSPW